jgi:hypothetical protein
MIGRKLALLAASLAGGAVLTWTIVETLREGPERSESAAAAAGDSIARLTARMGPADRRASLERTDGVRWHSWQRAAADLDDGGPVAVGSDGLLGNRQGRLFWNAWARGLDRGDAVAFARMRDVGAIERSAHREPRVRGQSYRMPTSPGLERTILTSGRRVDTPAIRLPRTASVNMALDGGRLPVRVEVCVSPAGKPREARILQGTGIETVDRYVTRRMLQGRYRPLWEDGRQVGFCEHSTIMLQTSQALQVARPPSGCGPDC